MALIRRVVPCLTLESQKKAKHSSFSTLFLFLKERLQPIEPLIPELSVLQRPLRHFPQWFRRERQHFRAAPAHGVLHQRGRLDITYVSTIFELNSGCETLAWIPTPFS